MVDACCIMVILGVALSGTSCVLLVVAMCALGCSEADHAGCHAPYSEYVKWHYSTKENPWYNTTMLVQYDVLEAFHIMSLMWCIVVCTLFGVCLCASHCIKKTGFIVLLIVMASVWSGCNFIAVGVFSGIQFTVIDTIHVMWRADCHKFIYHHWLCEGYKAMYALLVVSLIFSVACVIFAAIVCCLRGKSNWIKSEPKKHKPKP